MIKRLSKSKADVYNNLPSKEKNNLSGLLGLLGMGDHQEEPYLCKLVKNVIENKIEESKLLPADKRYTLEKRPGGIIIFVLGGLTLSESVALQKINENTRFVNIISGGNHILTIKG